MSLPKGYSVLHEIKAKKEAFEEEVGHCMGIRLTPEMAVKVREELHAYYSRDPGEALMTLFGAEIVCTDADELGFED